MTVQRWPVSVAGVPAFTPMGMHVADRLGDDYRVIGTTCGTGRTPITEPDIGTGKMFTELEAPRLGAWMRSSPPATTAPSQWICSGSRRPDATTIQAVSQVAGEGRHLCYSAVLQRIRGDAARGRIRLLLVDLLPVLSKDELVHAGHGEGQHATFGRVDQIGRAHV